MSLYQLPKLELPKLKLKPIGLKNRLRKFSENRILSTVILAVFISSICSFILGGVFIAYFYRNYLAKLDINLPQFLAIIKNEKTAEDGYIPQTTEEEKVIKTVERVSPAVVSIVITKDVPIMEEYFYNPFEGFGLTPFELQIPQYRQKGTEKKEIGGGSGFFVSEDGMILTNKHVVLDKEAEYTVFTNDGKSFPAKVLARDPGQDLAILKIEREKAVNSDGTFSQKPFPILTLGDSSKLQMGQTVIAIGNALGEFRNTVSVGVISGLGRTVTASGGSFVETIEDVIQTDAAINKGNSGGPLLNLKGEVVGINTAMVLEAQSIGFAIPADKAQKDIEQVKTSGKITYPYLGIYYAIINKNLQEKNNLAVDYGAWVGRNQNGEKTDQAVMPDTAAEKAGLERDDIVLEFNGEKITSENSLAKIIQKYIPGDEVTLKILRGGQEKIITATLGERSE